MFNVLSTPSDATSAPQSPPDGGCFGTKSARRGIKVFGALQFVGVIIFTMAAIVSHSNGSGSSTATGFYVTFLLLCILGAFLTITAQQYKNQIIMFAFVGVVVIDIIILLIFMGIDAFKGKCGEYVTYILWCNQGERQNALTLLVYDACLIVLLGLVVFYGLRLRKQMEYDEMMEARRTDRSTSTGTAADATPVSLEGGD